MRKLTIIRRVLPEMLKGLLAEIKMLGSNPRPYEDTNFFPTDKYEDKYKKQYYCNFGY